MKAAPPSIELANSIKSAGNNSYWLTRQISPITTLLHSTFVNFPSLLTYVVV